MRSGNLRRSETEKMILFPIFWNMMIYGTVTNLLQLMDNLKGTQHIVKYLKSFWKKKDPDNSSKLANI